MDRTLKMMSGALTNAELGQTLQVRVAWDTIKVQVGNDCIDPLMLLRYGPNT